MSIPIDRMPRGGPDASWPNRLFETGRLEFTDRYDVSDTVKQKVIGTLERGGERFGTHRHNAVRVLKQVADIANPKILEIGAGHGRLSAEILARHPTIEVTVSDLDPASVDKIAAGPLGANPRATVRVIDATTIDAPDNAYDLVVFAAALHHLPPKAASQVIADATRAGRKFLVIDLERSSTLGLFCTPMMMGFIAAVSLTVTPPSALPPFLHDAFISRLRSYSRSAFRALGAAADPAMVVEFLPGRSRYPPMLAVLYTRPQ
ncbi:class I SAM-dependent methyltransferase [Nocardia altamirensis]|uniref:class I SAM-dependent methyltransferase n=1 Tax=Nocardia altamirensis TaxID=472158 RepID=UPI001FE09E7A|nr:class I SAM-dependent methyltransferase [Nocardia altamirensis]